MTEPKLDFEKISDRNDVIAAQVYLKFAEILAPDEIDWLESSDTAQGQRFLVEVFKERVGKSKEDYATELLKDLTS